METGCKLGSPDKFENDKLYSNAITQQNERAWYCFGFKKEHDDKLGFLTVFLLRKSMSNAACQ